MQATVIIIGAEILLGRVTDTNSGYIARQLDPLGIEVKRIVTVDDNAAQIRDAVQAALADTSLVITTGGLGPTKDDITKKVLMEIFGGELVFDPDVYTNVERIFREKHLCMNHLTHDQALVPTSCRVIQNVYGTAPVMWFERDGRVLVSLPGVPHEACSMMRDYVTAEIARHFTPETAYAHRTLQVTGISESGLAERIAAWEDSLPDGFHLAYLPDAPIIKLRIDGSGTDAKALNATIDNLWHQLDDSLGDLVIDRSERTLPEIVIERLRSKGLTMGTAESCTGGNIAHVITQVAGCSDVFNGGIVSYSNEVKINVLAVPADTISRHGAVSGGTVHAMLDGAKRATGSDCAVATSGIAGPGGGTPDKPVGTVWIGACVPGLEPLVECHHFPGDRDRVITRATRTALLKLLSLLDN